MVSIKRFGSLAKHGDYDRRWRCSADRKGGGCVNITRYGLGGFDPSLPNGNIVESFEVVDIEPTAEEVARASAIAKLQALGLTEEEALALLG
jgi:hypothetical protein